MRHQYLAYHLSWTALFVVCSSACGPTDPPATDLTPDSGTNQVVEIPADCTLDSDIGTSELVITHLGLPSMNGFDLDGINNAPSPGGVGQNVAGCGKVDIAGGVDNALSTIATSLKDVIDLGTALQSTLAVPAPGGGTTGGPLSIRIALSRLAAGNPHDDASVCASVSVADGDAAPSAFAARGRIVSDTLYLEFDESLVFQVGLEVPPTSCNGGVCNPGDLQIEIRGGRARLPLDATRTHAQAGSLLGGFIFFVDADAAYAGANASGFQAALEAYATEVNLGSSFQAMAVQAFAGARDLHMNVDGTLSPCTGANTASTNKNSVSVALAIDSL